MDITRRNISELLAATGFTDEDMQALIGDEPAELLGDPDVIPDPPPEPITKPGDVWILDKHRLMCGDATSAEDHAKLLGDAKPALMVTDPPYGVEYDADWRNEALGEAERRTGEVANDDRVDWSAAFKHFKGAVVYAWHASQFTGEAQRALESAGFPIRASIIWAKPRFSISRGHYHWQHEPCWYAVRKGATAAWIGDRSQTTLWQVALKDDTGETGHSTQKPVELFASAIRDHKGDVYEPFSGSGSCVIACEKLGRRCYAMEIEPKYVDVAVKRWETLTGKKAVLDS